MDRPIDAVAVRCYEEEVDGIAPVNHEGFNYQRRVVRRVARDEEKKATGTYTVQQGDTLGNRTESMR